MQYLLAHDLGTSGDKASLFTVDGTLVKKRGSQLSVLLRQRQLCGAKSGSMVCSGLPTTQSPASLVDPARIAGVSFSGHMMGAVLLDGSGALLRPAIIWADQRAVSEQALLSQRVGVTGGSMRLPETATIPPIPSARSCAFMAHDGLDGRLAKALNCKDYLVYRLTGYLGTDYSDASGTGAFDLNTFTWPREILEAAGVPMSVMPELHASTDWRARLRPVRPGIRACRRARRCSAAAATAPPPPLEQAYPKWDRRICALERPPGSPIWTTRPFGPAAADV